MESNRKSGRKRGIVGLVVGAAVGIAAGLLLAPKTGAQLRADVRRTGGAWKTKAGAKAAELTKSGSARLGKARQDIGPMISRIGGRRAGTTTETDAVNESREETAERSG